MKRILLTALLAALGSGCSRGEMPGEHTASIINGEPSETDPGVVALGFVGFGTHCTGALVGDRTILTAAHCVIDGMAAFFAIDDALPQDSIEVASWHRHPDFRGADLTHDLALLELAHPAPEAAPPYPLFTGPLGDEHIGRSIRLIGFGRDELGEHGRRKSGVTTISDVGPTEFRFAPNPAQTCVGDSGGPALMVVDGIEHVIGVTSRGDPDCQLHGVDVRVDAYLDSFLEPTLDQLEDSEVTGCSSTPRPAGLLVLLLAAALCVSRRR